MDDRQSGFVHIPEDLDEVIRRGISSGQAVAARRRKRRKLAARCVCAAVLTVGLFAGGVRFSPAFAAAVREIPVLGQLVQVFATNQPLVQGGGGAGDGAAALTMERSGDTEWIRLEFQQTDAARYQAEFASCPKTVTITLPGTTGVEVLSEISRAGDTSQYIKSVCQLPAGAPDTTVLQLELESDADVQIQEYRAPGGLVIRLTPAGIGLEEIYSLRTLSLDREEAEQALARYADQEVRVLRDDGGLFFLEFGQFSDREEAETAGSALPGDVIVEARVGNNVPVCFATLEAYQSSCLLDEYQQVLRSALTVEPVLDFLDLHFAQAGEEERETMLRGLSGLLEDYEEPADWERIAAFYQMAGQACPDIVTEQLLNMRKE